MMAHYRATHVIPPPRPRPWDQTDVRNAQARAKSYGVVNTLTHGEWREVVGEHNFLCYLCNRQLTLESGKDNTLNLEHIQPLSRGGANTKENVAPACLVCNKAKQALMLPEFLELAKRWLEVSRG